MMLGFLCWVMSLFVIFLESPYSLMVLLLAQALVVVVYLGVLKYSLWFSYILFMVFLGGLLIVFSYMTSLIPFFKPLGISSANKMFITLMIMGGFMVLVASKELAGSGECLTKVLESQYSVSSLYVYSSAWMYVYVVLYLLMTLFCVSCMTNTSSGPLRLLE